MNPRTILFLHQSFPGQFGHLAASLAADGHKVFALAMNPQLAVPGVTLIRYHPERQTQKDMPFLLQEMDAKLIRAESAYQVMKAMKEQGVNPDVVYAHPGWGEIFFVRNVWPKTRLIVYAEWYYNVEGQEVNFDKEFPVLSEEEELRLTFKNNVFLHALSDCDAAISPTEWQKSRFPAWAQEKISVIHEGFSLKELAMVKPRTLGIPSQGLKLRKGLPIVTYCARHLEPIRGFHYFMRMLPTVMDTNPDVHVIIMGQDAGIQNVGYGRQNPDGITWRKSMQNELGSLIDWSRVHFLGMLDRKLYLAMLKLSACHVYLTTPFILSWSFLEAAALGLPIVASDTAPVQEFSRLHGIESVQFDDVDGIAQKVLYHLDHMKTDYFSENLDMLTELDITRTIPEIKQLLFNEEPKQPVQQEPTQAKPQEKDELVFEETDDEETPPETSTKAQE